MSHGLRVNSAPGRCAEVPMCRGADAENSAENEDMQHSAQCRGSGEPKGRVAHAVPNVTGNGAADAEVARAASICRASILEPPHTVYAALF